MEDTRNQSDACKNIATTICRKMVAVADGDAEARAPLDAAMERLHQGDIRGATQQLSRLCTPNTRKDEEITPHSELNLTADKIGSYIKDCRKKGVKTDQAIREFLSTLRIMAGQKIYNFVATTLNCGHERTARRWVSESHATTGYFVAGVHRSNFVLLRDLYKSTMSSKQIVGPIPCMLAEDETSLNCVLQWDSSTDQVVGSCGKLCGLGCTTIKDCRRKGCMDPHSCVYDTDTLALIIGDDGNSFARLSEYIKKSKIARQLRVIIINPLHKDLPKIPLVVIGTCSTYSYAEYLRSQWQAVEALFDTVFNPIGLFQHGHSSDGDSRRRLAYFEHGKSTFGTRYGIDADGFTFSGQVSVGGKVMLNLDQDYFHVIKKLWNAANHPSRLLRIGPKMHASLESLRVVIRNVPQAEHGCKESDLDRSGYKAMDVPSILRLITVKALRVFDTVCNIGWGNVGPQPYLQGTILLLKVIRSYASLFLSKEISNVERIVRAGYVTTYLRLWREWTKNTDIVSQRVNYLTREGSIDAIMSCHFVVLLIKLYTERYPAQPCPFNLAGTQCCEDLFSHLGSFVANKRTYSLLDAIRTIRADIFVQGTSMYQGYRNKWKMQKYTTLWEEDAEQDGLAPVNPTDWPTDDQRVTAWNTGKRNAYGDAIMDELKPPKRRGVYPDWWRNPHLFDPKARAVAGSQNEEALLVDDQEDEGDEDGDEDEDDDAHVNNDNGDSDSSWGDSDEDRPLKRSAGVSEDSDDDVPLTCLKRAAGNGSVTTPKTVSMLLTTPDGSVTTPTTVSMLLTTPDGKRRHKAQVVQELAGSGTKVSADRSLRVKQAIDVPEAKFFDVTTDSWTMTRGTDIAILFDGKAKNVCVARVIGIRKRHSPRGGWSHYQQPVVLHEDRSKLGDLFVTCYFYSRIKGRGDKKADWLFRFNVGNPAEIQVEAIICPVQMTYFPAMHDGCYLLNAKSKDILNKQMQGHTTWKGGSC